MSIDRRTFLRGAAALVGLNAVSHLFGSAPLWPDAWGAENVSGAPLRERAAKKGLLYGAAGGCNVLTKDKEFAAHFAEECGILVPEGELKWKALRPTPDTFNFAPGDCLAGFAAGKNMRFRGHTLVWHDSLPAWFQRTVNRQNAERMLREHITTVVDHYKGRMHSWDVVNEPIATWDHLSNGMRSSPWLALLGESYIDIAFRTAAAADPNALLVLNMNHLEYNSQGVKEMRAATLSLLRRLKKSGTPVQALGIQAHLDPKDGSFNATEFKAFLQEVKGLDLKILITELDVIDQSFPGDPKIRDQVVAQKYEEFLSAALEESAVIAVLTWGLSDKYTWLSEYKPRPDKAPVRPLPLDANYNRTLAWSAIASAFDKAPTR